MSTAPVVRAVTVNAPAARAFAIFTGRIGDWWPLSSYSVAASRAADVAFLDGRLVETADDGTTVVWGAVTEWDPPHRLAFTWAPGGGPETSIGIDFEDSDGQTRVVLTHSGWEVFGEDAPGRRANYDSDQAWGWVLRLFALALGTERETPELAVQPVATRAYDVSLLRAGYESVAVALEQDPFEPPPAGEWNARQVAGHVITNAELMSKVLDDLRKGSLPRLHGPDDHAPEAIGRCDNASFEDAAGEVRRAGAELVARCAALTDEELATAVSTYIEHDGTVVVDGELTVGELLAAEVHRHLPAHVGQIADLTG
jgi:uncharacterized protein YndB with AHSA1/START domain